VQPSQPRRRRRTLCCRRQVERVANDQLTNCCSRWPICEFARRRWGEREGAPRGALPPNDVKWYQANCRRGSLTRCYVLHACQRGSPVHSDSKQIRMWGSPNPNASIRTHRRRSQRASRLHRQLAQDPLASPQPSLAGASHRAAPSQGLELSTAHHHEPVARGPLPLFAAAPRLAQGRECPRGGTAAEQLALLSEPRHRDLAVDQSSMTSWSHDGRAQ